MTGRHSLWLLLGCVGLLAMCPRPAAAAPVSVPATRPIDTPGFWLDRARRDIEEMLRRPVAGGLFYEGDLAIQLMQARGDAEDRRMLEGMLRNVEKRLPTTKPAEEGRWRVAELKGRFYAALGDRDNALRSYAEAQRLLPTLSTQPTNYLGMSFSDMVAWGMKVTLAEWGEYDRAMAMCKDPQSEADSAWAALGLAQWLAAGGHAQLAAKAIETARQVAEKEPEEDMRRMRFQMLCQTQAQIGDYTGAMATAAGLHDPAAGYMDVVDEAWRNGDLAAARAAATALMQLKNVQEGEHGICNRILQTDWMEALGDRELLAAVMRAADRPQGWHRDALQLDLSQARGHILLGQREEAARMAQAARAEIDRMGDREYKGETLAQLAGVWAMMNDPPNVEATLKVGDAAGGPIREGMRICLGYVVMGYCHCGNAEAALATIELRLKEDKHVDSDYLDAARALARKGKIEAARTAARRVKQEFMRAKAFRFAALAQAKAGRRDEVAKWVDQIDDPRIRTILDLGVAQQMQGVEYRGPLRVYW